MPATRFGELATLQGHRKQTPADAVLIFDHRHLVACPVQGERGREADIPAPRTQYFLRAAGLQRIRRGGRLHRRRKAPRQRRNSEGAGVSCRGNDAWSGLGILVRES